MKLTVKEAKMLRQIARGDALPTSAKDAEIMQSLLERGAVARISGEIRIAPEGRQAMRRQKLAQEEEQLYAAQHQDRITLPPASEQLAGVSEQAKEGEGRQGTCNRSKKKTGSYKAHAAPVRLNRSESPLAQLALRKRPDGTPYLKPHLVTAGERLRQDFEKGQVGPSLGINWDRLGEVAGSVSKNARNRAEGRILSGAASSARQRFRAAMSYVGEELSGVLVDVCCFLKGLEEIERSRQWPARSAKQILELALSRLARHYGLEEVAFGPEYGRVRHWGLEGYRPDFGEG